MKQLLIPIDPEGVARVGGSHLVPHRVWYTHGEKPQQIGQNIYPMPQDPERGVQHRPWLLHA